MQWAPCRAGIDIKLFMSWAGKDRGAGEMEWIRKEGSEERVAGVPARTDDQHRDLITYATCRF